MKLEHLAIWVSDLERMKSYYEKYFSGRAGELYHNPKKRFHSYFITFTGSEARLEIMHRPDIAKHIAERGFEHGLAHFAMAVGSKEAVNDLTERLRQDGYTIAGEPRTTGDGYYESVVLDPEGNQVEITV